MPPSVPNRLRPQLERPRLRRSIRGWIGLAMALTVVATFVIALAVAALMLFKDAPDTTADVPRVRLSPPQLSFTGNVPAPVTPSVTSSITSPVTSLNNYGIWVSANGDADTNYAAWFDHGTVQVQDDLHVNGKIYLGEHELEVVGDRLRLKPTERKPTKRKLVTKTTAR